MANPAGVKTGPFKGVVVWRLTNAGNRYVRARWPTVYGEKGRFYAERNGLSVWAQLIILNTIEYNCSWIVDGVRRLEIYIWHDMWVVGERTTLGWAYFNNKVVFLIG